MIESTAPDFLYDAQCGFYQYCTLKAAFDNGLFDLLRDAATPQELAMPLGADAAVMEKLLEALLVLGLVRREGRGFRNTVLAETYCVSNGSAYQGILFRHTHQTFGEPFLRQASELRPPDAPPDWDEQTRLAGMRASIGYVLPQTLAQVMLVITGLPSFRRAKTFLDLGAGPGLFGMEVAKTRPDIRVDLFDLPAVIEETERIVADRGMTGHVRLLSGDMFAGDIPNAYDIIFASDCIMPDRARLPALLGVLHQRLAPTGTLIIRHLETTRDDAAPKANALLEFGAALNGLGDYMFSCGDLPAALAEVGFQAIEEFPQWHMTHRYVIHVASKV